MDMEAGMKVVGYVRVSTEEQARTGVSLDTQKQKIRAWAEAMDAELIAMEEDAGISGKLMRNREGLQTAIERACEEKAALVVYSLSRLSRSLKDTLAITEKLEAAGGDLVSISERIDTTSASGKMVFRLLCVLNQFEREVLSERTSAALQHKKANGLVYGPTPYGCRRKGKRLVPDQDEQVVLHLNTQCRHNPAFITDRCKSMDRCYQCGSS